MLIQAQITQINTMLEQIAEMAENSSISSNPHTGDSDSLWLWIILLFLSGSTAALLVLNKKGRQTHS